MRDLDNDDGGVRREPDEIEDIGVKCPRAVEDFVGKDVVATVPGTFLYVGYP